MNLNKIKEKIIIKMKVTVIKNLKIGRKIFLSFIILILIFTIIIGIQIFGLQKLKNTINSNNNTFSSALNISNIENKFALFQISINDMFFQISLNDIYLNKNSIETMDSIINGLVDENMQDIFNEIEILEKNNNDIEIKKLIDGTKADLSDFFQLNKELVLLIKANKKAEADQVSSKRKNSSSKVNADLFEINMVLSQEYMNKSSTAEKTATHVLWIAIVSAIACSAIGITFAFLLIRNVNRGIKSLLEYITTSISYIMAGDFNSRLDPDKINLPDFISILRQINKLIDAFTLPMTTAANHIAVIAKGLIPPMMPDNYSGDFKVFADNVNALINSMITVTNVAENIAKGNLNIQVKSRSEEDAIMQAMQLSIKNLTEFAISVQSASEQVAIGNQEITSGAQQISFSTTQQAANIEEISSSIEEINSSVALNAHKR